MQVKKDVEKSCLHCRDELWRHVHAWSWIKLTTCRFNPNTLKSYKISQKLSPKHAARGVAQSPYPTYRHGKACLSEQPPWRAAGDPPLACCRSRVRAPAPAGLLRTLFFSPPSLSSPLGEFFRTFSTNPVKVLGLIMTFVCETHHQSGKAARYKTSIN